MSVCNCETDGQLYVCCACCDAYVIEGEFAAHRYSCPGRQTPSAQGTGGRAQCRDLPPRLG